MSMCGRNSQYIGSLDAGCAYLVFQVDDDALGSLQADSFDSFQEFVVSATDDVTKFRRAEGRENHPGGISSDSGYTDEEQEKFPFLLGGKTVQDVSIFADGFYDIEFDVFFALDG